MRILIFFVCFFSILRSLLMHLLDVLLLHHQLNFYRDSIFEASTKHRNRIYFFPRGKKRYFIYFCTPRSTVEVPGSTWEYHGSIWEYHGSTMGVPWEYHGSTVGVQWEREHSYFCFSPLVFPQDVRTLLLFKAFERYSAPCSVMIFP